METQSLKQKTLFITGAGRGIGKAISLRAAADGANIAVAAKTVEPHPKLPGTIYTAVDEIEAAGGRGLACPMDIRFEDQVRAAVEQAAEHFGGIDILVNNAGAIFLAGTADTPMKRFDLMHAVNVRGTFMTSQACLPHLVRAANSHILSIAPPLNMEAKWFAPYPAYAMSKYGMSMCVLGMAEELRPQGVAVNALWPKTFIATSAVRNMMGEDAFRRSRKPEIMAAAAHSILLRDSRKCTGQFFVDEEVLADDGVSDLTQYSVVPSAKLLPDVFL
ncbi:MAG: NAD(P)-dependent oxidoreductase [Planctomycetes bacterium]|nr:NAD(P)-dependent oxidoreductase [Planctomycetota bacterium]MBL7038902.1 NAD(P)-dependent oxidoreductase [Pirellulaceae bacterium]